MATVNESEIVVEVTDSLHHIHKLSLTKEEAKSLHDGLDKLFGEKKIQYPRTIDLNKHNSISSDSGKLIITDRGSIGILSGDE